MLRAIGLDLGTSKSVLAALRRGEPQVIPNREESAYTPSALGLGPAGELLIGQTALDQLDGGPGRTALSFKPRLGLSAGMALGGITYTPGELAALLMARLKEDAEAALGEPVGRVVLAVPASFGQRQLGALRAAAQQAGLFVWQIVHDTVAAALAYNYAQPDAQAHTLLVCDLGGGCLDVAVLHLFSGALTVLGLAGAGWLGGDDLTQSLVAYLQQRLQEERLDDILGEPQQARQRLWTAAEQARVALSTVDSVDLILPAGAHPLLGQTLTRTQLEELIRPRLEEVLGVVERALAAGRQSAENIEGILLVGGATRTPLLHRLLAERFPQASLLGAFNPLTGVGLGAALRAGMLAEVICPTCRLANAIEAQVCRRCCTPLAGQSRLVCPRCFLPNDPSRQSCYKCDTSLRQASLPRLVQPSEEAICRRCGASLPEGQGVCPACHAQAMGSVPDGLRCGRCGLVQRGGLQSCASCGELLAPFVGDVAGHSLGIEAPDERLDVVLPRGRPLPSPQPVVRELPCRGRRSLEIAVYEGEKRLARENTRCYRLCIDLPAEAPMEAVVQVAFALDRDGLLAVSASYDNAELLARLESV